MPVPCFVDGCTRLAVARGLCASHYATNHKRGTLPPRADPLPDYAVDESGCWVWLRVPASTGYGMKSINGRSVLAHRWYYEQHRGSIPEGLTPPRQRASA